MDAGHAALGAAHMQLARGPKIFSGPTSINVLHPVIRLS
jgi:hypothetical protein